MIRRGKGRLIPFSRELKIIIDEFCSIKLLQNSPHLKWAVLFAFDICTDYALDTVVQRSGTQLLTGVLFLFVLSDWCLAILGVVGVRRNIRIS